MQCQLYLCHHYGDGKCAKPTGPFHFPDYIPCSWENVMNV